MPTLREQAPAWGALTLAILIGATPAAPAATLRWKLKPGDVFHYVMEQKTITNLKRNGADLGKITQSFTVDLTRTVKSVADDGSAEMTQRFDRVRMNYDAGPIKVNYDSAKEPDPATAQLVAALKAMVGAEFSFKMSARGEMSDVRVPESVSKAFREAGSRGGSADQFSEEGFKKSLIETSVTFPAEDLNQGQSWSRQLKIAAPDGGQIVQTRTYTYEGPDAQEAGADKIGITSKIELQADPASNQKTELKTQDCKGSLFFDSKGGRMVSSTVSEKTETSIKVMDAKIDQFVDQNTTMKLAPATEETK